MSKFTADRVYKMQDEDGNTIISFVVSGSNKYAANMSVEELKKISGSKISVEAKQYKSKRSLEQNKLLWALLGKMAFATTGSKDKIETEDCYCQMLERANVECDFLLCLPKARELLEQNFRVVKEIGEREVNGKVLKMYQVWLGSSTFDTKQMTELIEVTLDKLAELGVYDSEVEQAWEEYKNCPRV